MVAVKHFAKSIANGAFVDYTVLSSALTAYIDLHHIGLYCIAMLNLSMAYALDGNDCN